MSKSNKEKMRGLFGRAAANSLLNPDDEDLSSFVDSKPPTENTNSVQQFKSKSQGSTPTPVRNSSSPKTPPQARQ